MRVVLTCLLLLLSGSLSFAQPAPKVIQIYNNDPNGTTIYPVIELGIKGVDEWLIGWFQNCGCYALPITQGTTNFASSRLYRLYVNGTAGVAAGAHVEVSLPFYSQLVTPPNGNNIDQFIDWWNGGRVYIYDSATEIKTHYDADKQFPVPSSAEVPSCAACSELQIRTGGGLPLEDHSQLTEYTFADTITTQWPFKIKTGGVGYNISSVDHTYLPLAMAPVRAAPPIPYIGTIMSTQSFRAILNQWLTDFGGWPLYRGTDGKNGQTYVAPRIPGAYNAFIGENPYSASSPLATDCKLSTGGGVCAPLDAMIGIYNNCLPSTTGICQFYSPLIKKTEPLGLFVKNYNTFSNTNCHNPNVTGTALDYVTKIYGWVSFNEIDVTNPSCKDATIKNSLLSSATDAAEFNNLLNNDYVTGLQDDGSLLTPSFNPYVQLISAQKYLHESAYSYSVNDKIGFQSYTADGIVITFSGDGTHCVGLPLCVPIDLTKKVALTMGVLRNSPAVPQWSNATFCDPNVPVSIDPDFPSIVFYPQPSQLPCSITVTDFANQLHSLTLNQVPPLTPGSIPCTFPRFPSWCVNTKIVDANDINTAADTPGPPASTHDLNGDGYSDLLWRDTNSGNIVAWLYQFGQPVVAGSPIGGLSGIASVGQRDFDLDGKADLLWQDGAGNVSIWFMYGTNIVPPPNTAHPPTWFVAPLPGWSVAGTGDFNNDGMGDLLLKDANNDYAVWLLNGKGRAIIAGGSMGNVPGWSVVGTGDFNGDGKADILWMDGSGNVSMWFMNGVGVPTAGAVGNIGTTWSVVGTGDFNGDGKADIVWRDNAGDVAIWLMNGAAVSSSAGLGLLPAVYSVASTGDFNRDGKSDLLWRNTSTGDTSIWFMNGTAVSSATTVGNVPPNWTIVSTNAD